MFILTIIPAHAVTTTTLTSTDARTVDYSSRTVWQEVLTCCPCGPDPYPYLYLPTQPRRCTPSLLHFLQLHP